MSETTVIIGAGPGLGAALARRFGREGHAIGLVGRRPERLDAQAATLREAGIEARTAVGDAGDEASLDGALGNLLAEGQAPACLIYNAYALTKEDPLSLTPERLVADFRANVAGALTAARAVVPAMRRAGRGSVLFTGGGFAFEPMPAVASLGVGKAGLRNLAFSLHAALKPQGLHVATVTICGLIGEGRFSPDAIAEAFWSLHAEPDPEHWRREIEYR